MASPQTLPRLGGVPSLPLITGTIPKNKIRLEKGEPIVIERKLRCFAAAAVLIADAVNASASESQAAPLDAVTVNAQKISQTEQGIPASVAVIGSEQMEQSRIRSLDDASLFAGNVLFNKNQLFIRGIGTANSLGFDPSVPVLVDGVYLGRATAALTPLLDLEQIEIVRGPQGTLLGKNTVGGAINLVTAEPGQELSAKLSASRGPLDPYSVHAAASVPVTEEFSMRLSALSDRSDGYVFNSSRQDDELGRRNEAYRARLSWQPSAEFKAWLSLESDRFRLDGYAQQVSVATAPTLALYRRYDPEAEAVIDYNGSLDQPDTGGRRRGRLATLNAEYRFGDQRLTLLSSKAASKVSFLTDADHSPVPLLTLGSREDYNQWSHELRLDGAMGDLDYLAGIYFFDSQLDVRSLITQFPRGSEVIVTDMDVGMAPPEWQDIVSILESAQASGDPVHDESRKVFLQSAENRAFYTMVNWQAAPHWSLGAGLRWTFERKDVHMNQSYENNGLLFQQLLGEEPYDARRRHSEHDLSPRLVVQHEWSPDTRLFATFARGFKGGGFNDLAPTPDKLEFQAERSESVEAGIKSFQFDNRLLVQLTLFDSNLDNLQVVSYDGTSFYIRNAAAVRSRGAEIESRWQLEGGWRIQASAGYLDAYYKSFPDAPVAAGQSGETQDLSGVQLPTAPHHSAALGLLYSSAAWTDILRWQVGVDALYRSWTSLALDNDPIDSQPAYVLWNASAALVSDDDRWQLRFNAQNIGNEIVINTTSDIALFSGNHWAEVNPPRRLSLCLELHW